MDRLLFVDDEPFVLSALRRTFEAESFEVVTALGPEAGLKAFAEAGPFQVVCSDYRMPGMTGAAFLERVRREDPNAFRILLTAVEEFDVAVEAINRGEIHRYLSKPWNHGQFIGVVKESCEQYHLREHTRELTEMVHAKNEELERLNHGLEREVQERTNSLLEGLIAALDYRDTETQWHSRRVASYAKRIATELGVGGQELSDIEQGSLLHDIGKIGVPDAILLKPGPLSADEWVVMKKHPEYGYELLRNVHYLERARLIVLQHQERFDGKGYPQGLASADILLGARIFAVVDTFDAITSDRPYRKAAPDEVARAEIARCTGTQFDPDVVRAFERLPRAELEGIRRDVEQLASVDADRLGHDHERIAAGAVRG